MGCCAAFLGLGVLFGSGFESGLLCKCIAFGLILLGLCFIRQK